MKSGDLVCLDLGFDRCDAIRVPSPQAKLLERPYDVEKPVEGMHLVALVPHSLDATLLSVHEHQVVHGFNRIAVGGEAVERCQIGVATGHHVLNARVDVIDVVRATIHPMALLSGCAVFLEFLAHDAETRTFAAVRPRIEVGDACGEPVGGGWHANENLLARVALMKIAQLPAENSATDFQQFRIVGQVVTAMKVDVAFNAAVEPERAIRPDEHSVLFHHLDQDDIFPKKGCSPWGDECR